jgi:Fe-S oxidoreductase
MIPSLETNAEELGCSGLAGTFGLTKEQFKESTSIGHKLIERMRSSEYQFGMTECSSCKFQMEQQSTTPTLHPLKVLALSYGLMPELRRRFKPNLRKRLTS